MRRHCPIEARTQAMETSCEARARAERIPEGMIEIPAGDYLFGPLLEPRDLPAYAIDRAPVTVEEYLCRAPRYDLPIPDHVRIAGRNPWKANDPVVGISWHDAARFAHYEGCDLPTEEEWEKAARGRNGYIYAWGNAFDASRCNTKAGGRRDTTSVIHYPLGASPFGALDCCGNVWEWTSTESGGGLVALKGGSWMDPPALARCDRSLTARKEFRSSTIGFRRVWREGRAGRIVYVPAGAAPEPAVPREAAPQGEACLDASALLCDRAALEAAVSRLMTSAGDELPALDAAEIAAALARTLPPPEATELNAAHLYAFELSIAKGDLAAARDALHALVQEPGGAPDRVENLRTALSAAETIAAARPQAAARDDFAAWLTLGAVLALANLALLWLRLRLP